MKDIRDNLNYLKGFEESVECWILILYRNEYYVKFAKVFILLWCCGIMVSKIFK